ncbi:MAG: glycosyltransferase family 2 protein, partial [Halapricum sp.]
MSWEYTVSFLMPVYDGADFVAEAIESVLAQTFESVQLVIVDDGSTDDSRAVIEQYLPHEDITLVSQHNQGVTETTNRAIKLADGKYLGVHPQDDQSLPDRLERQV